LNYMPYLKEGQLRNYASGPEYQSRTVANVKTLRNLAQVTIFLSHSHRDRELARGLVRFLASWNMTIYVDWNDSDMANITNRETAEAMKSKIRENKLFIILATRNALASKWVGWETGVAEQCKGNERIIVMPVAEANGCFEGSEYLELYGRVEPTELGGFGVFSPGKTSAVTFKEYITLYGTRQYAEPPNW
jgi:hypothetical protein